jgi:hypothetical protein
MNLHTEILPEQQKGGLLMQLQAKPRLLPQEYLALEREAAHKSEYFDGEIFAMAGAGKRLSRFSKPRRSNLQRNSYA